jgi:hypothetical protein
MTILMPLAILAIYLAGYVPAARRLVWHRYQQNLKHYSKRTAENDSMFEGSMMALVWPIMLPYAVIFHFLIRVHCGSQKGPHGFMRGMTKTKDAKRIEVLERENARLERELGL